MTERQDRNVEDLEKEITCAICHDHYTDPKVLPCCHYYCKQCIQDLTQRTGVDRPFSCPECRKTTTLPQGGVDNLPPAHFIHHLKTIHSNMEQAHVAGVQQAPIATITTTPKPVIVRHALPVTSADNTPSSQTTTAMTPNYQATTTMPPYPPKQATLQLSAPKPPAVQKQVTLKVEPSRQGANLSLPQSAGAPNKTRRKAARSQRQRGDTAHHRGHGHQKPQSESEDLINCCFCLLSVIFPPLLCVWIIYCITRLN